MAISYNSGVRDTVGFDNLTLTYPASPTDPCAVAIVIAEGGSLAAPVYRGRTMTLEVSNNANNQDVGVYTLSSSELALGSGNTATCGASGTFGQWCIALFEGVDQSSLGSLAQFSGSIGGGASWGGYTSALATGEWAVIGAGRQAASSGAQSGWDGDIGSPSGSDDVSMLAAYESSTSQTVTYNSDPYNAGCYAGIELQEATATGQTLTAPLFTSSGSIFTPSLSPTLGLPAIASGSTLHLPSLTPGSVQLTAPLYGPDSTIHLPSLAASIGLALPLHGPESSIPTPSLSLGSVQLTAPLYGPDTTLHLPSLSVGAQSLTLPLTGPDSTIHLPTLSVGSVTVTTPLYGPDTTLHLPSLAQEGTLVTPLFTSSGAIHEPGLSPTLGLPAVGPGSTIHTPSLSGGEAGLAAGGGRGGIILQPDPRERERKREEPPEPASEPEPVAVALRRTVPKGPVKSTVTSPDELEITRQHIVDLPSPDATQMQRVRSRDASEALKADRKRKRLESEDRELLEMVAQAVRDGLI